MSDFRPLSDRFSVSPQITVEDVREAARIGFTHIVNNRPEGESPDQTPGAEIAAAAKAAGLAYTAIPVGHAGFSMEQVTAMDAILAETGRTLAYCRSGTRSTMLWALARSSEGAEADELSAAAASAGYDLTPLQPLMQQLREQAN